MTAIGDVGQTHYALEELYICDPTTPYHGLRSWDNFFIRPSLHSKLGPFDPIVLDPTSVLVNACKSTLYSPCEKIPSTGYLLAQMLTLFYY